jgi:hypothetical protein
MSYICIHTHNGTLLCLKEGNSVIFRDTDESGVHYVKKARHRVRKAISSRNFLCATTPLDTI